MWWGNNSDKDSKAAAKDTPAETSNSAKDASKREKLPPAMQRILEKSEKEENFFDELVEG